MSETLRPPEEEIGRIRKKYEENMKPSLKEHLQDKLAGDSPLFESRKESMMSGIQEDAIGENIDRDQLKKLEAEASSPDTFKGPDSLKMLNIEEHKRAIENARKWVEDSAKKNL